MIERKACIENLIEQIRWIEDIRAHQFAGWGHTVGAMRQAVVLLKAQEPRVLDLAEIHGGMAVWIEAKGNADVTLAIGGSSGGGCKCFITVDDRAIAPHDSDYGVRWRAWTQEPTPEQREAVAWNG